MNNKKGFTLIEILSVVIIIGVMGIIGIVAISSYITESKQSSFVNVARMYLNGAKEMKSKDKFFHDPKNTEAMLVPLSEIEVEDDATKTPYGEIDFDNSYIVIVNIKGKYHYYITLKDESGHALILENVNTLSEDKIVASADRSGIPSIENLRNPANDLTLLIGEVKYELSDKNVYDGSGKINTSTILLDNSILGEFSIKLNKEGWTNENKIITVETYDESVTYQYYISNRSQKPLASDSGWTDNNEFSKDLGIYYIFVKDSNGEVSDPKEVEIKYIDREKPTCTLKVIGTPSAHGIYNSSVTVKIDKTYDGEASPTRSEVKNFGIGGLDSGDSVTDPATGVKTTVYTGYVEDHAGNQNTCTVTVKTDGISPTVSYSLAEGIYNTTKSVVITPNDGSGGVDYYNVRVTKDGTNIENKTNITSSTYTVNLSAEGEYVIYTKVLDTGGNWLDTSASSVNSNGEYFKTYKIDTTKPKCSLKADGTYSTETYFGSDVDISFSVHDDQTGTGTTYKSGIKNYGIGSVTGSKTAILSTDSEGTTYTGHIEDQAGNTNTCTLTVKRKSNFTVTYNLNGGNSCPSSTKAVTYDNAYGALCSPTRTGYTFVNWYSDTSLTNKVTSTTTFKNETSNLYAKWAANSFTVTLNPNQGSVTPTSITVSYDGTYADLPTASRTGYTFKGWYTSSSSGDKITTSTKVTKTDDHTLYAQWTPNNYTITFNGNGSTSGSMSQQTCSYGIECTITANAFAKSGYTFAGWSTSSSGSIAYTNKQKVTSIGNTTLYAIWVVTTTNFEYTGGGKTFTAPQAGTYKLEVWGAQGGDDTGSGGKGGYATGTIYLSKGASIYIYVGGRGCSAASSACGGYNGGGKAGSTGSSGGGGGATHIAKGTARGVLENYNSYRSEVLIVAGGGGGGGNSYGTINGGTGGGTSGSNPSGAGGAGTQTTGYAFGKGQNRSGGNEDGGGGGAGWFGGYASAGDGGGAGGSGYTGGVSNGSMQSGQRSGNGYARITYQG